MVDLVGTCPKGFWREWIAEGDAAGLPESGQEWGWYTGDSLALQAKPGDRFYVVAHGLLRGWAPVTTVKVLSFHPDHRPDPRGGAGSYVDHTTLAHWSRDEWQRWTDGQYVICRRGGAVACTIAEPVPGFRGLRTRWWDRSAETPFPEWQTAGIAIKRPQRSDLFAAQS